MKRCLVRVFAMLVAAASAAVPMSAAFPVTAEANSLSNFEVRKKVIGLSGIMSITGDLTQKVTRAQFARMLVLASKYRSILTEKSNVSVFADVLWTDEYASAIRIAAENGWMTGYLGGNFRPDQYVTLNEAAKGVLYLLGYTNDDFDGDQYNRRMAQYAYLDLNENINYSDPAEIMTRYDCVNLFYNLMKTKKKDSSSYYASDIDASVTSDGEVDALAMADNTLKGPKTASSKNRLAAGLPFDLEDANIFINGEAAEASQINYYDYVVYYYSSVAKTVWIYYADFDSDADRLVTDGIVEAVYYQSADTLVPSRVTLEGDDNYYYISSSEMQFAFSIYGTINVGDDIILVLENTGSGSRSSDDDEDDDDEGGTYYVVDYLEATD